MDIIFVFFTSNYTLCNKEKTFKIDRHSNQKDPFTGINSPNGYLIISEFSNEVPLRNINRTNA